jgi:hypothetical protein
MGKKTTIKLAEALLRRKELNDRVAVAKAIDESDIKTMVLSRKRLSDDIDDIQALVPTVSYVEVAAAHSYYARNLRLIDAVIQQANWTCEVEVADEVMQDFEPKEEPKRPTLPVQSRTY